MKSLHGYLQPMEHIVRAPLLSLCTLDLCCAFQRLRLRFWTGILSYCHMLLLVVLANGQMDSTYKPKQSCAGSVIWDGGASYWFPDLKRVTPLNHLRHAFVPATSSRQQGAFQQRPESRGMVWEARV